MKSLLQKGTYTRDYCKWTNWKYKDQNYWQSIARGPVGNNNGLSQIWVTSTLGEKRRWGTNYKSTCTISQSDCNTRDISKICPFNRKFSGNSRYLHLLSNFKESELKDHKECKNHWKYWIKDCISSSVNGKCICWSSRNCVN